MNGAKRKNIRNTQTMRSIGRTAHIPIGTPCRKYKKVSIAKFLPSSFSSCFCFPDFSLASAVQSTGNNMRSYIQFVCNQSCGVLSLRTFYFFFVVVLRYPIGAGAKCAFYQHNTALNNVQMSFQSKDTLRATESPSIHGYVVRNE